MFERIDDTEFQPTDNLEVTESNQEVTTSEELLVTAKVTEGNQEVTILELPATKKAVASYFSTSHQNLTKTWLAPLAEKGYDLFEGKKISESGFNSLKQLIEKQKESELSPKEFIDTLPSAGQMTESAIAIYEPKQPTEKSSLPVLVEAELEPLDLAVLQTPSTLERLEKLVEISNDQTAREIEEANQAVADVERAGAAIEKLKENSLKQGEARASKAEAQQVLSQISSLLGKS